MFSIFSYIMSRVTHSEPGLHMHKLVGLGKPISNLTNPINKMSLRLIYLKKLTFPSVKTTVDTLIDVRNETSKHHFLKSVK